jgi:NTE family protein
MKKVHLVLGCGGARGMAHIGVIEMLEEEGYEIVEVIGCSMGAVIGGIYCAGYLEQYKQWLLGLNKSSVFSLFDFTLTTQGFVKGGRIFNKVQELIGEQNIEELKIPFSAVATDMLHKKEVYFRSGNLFRALRASIAIPGVFTPVVTEDSILADGGILNPLPLNLVTKKKDAIIVAVNLNGPILYTPKLEQPLKEEDANAYWEWLPKLPLLNKKDIAETTKALPRLSLFDLLTTSYNYTQDRLTELMIECYKPDFVIEIPRNVCTTFDFHRAEEIIEEGKKAYKKAFVFQ